MAVQMILDRPRSGSCKTICIVAELRQFWSCTYSTHIFQNFPFILRRYETNTGIKNREKEVQELGKGSLDSIRFVQQLYAKIVTCIFVCIRKSLNAMFMEAV